MLQFCRQKKIEQKYGTLSLLKHCHRTVFKLIQDKQKQVLLF